MAMKIYVMPNGIKRQYEEGTAPDGAKLVTAAKKVEEPVIEEKAVEEIKNKAVTKPKNKAVKGKSKK